MADSGFQELYALADEDGKVMLDERAAIYEYDANHSRERAEEMAAVEYAIYDLKEIQSGRAAQKIIANRTAQEVA